MSIFGSIMSRIFPAAATPQAQATPSPAAPGPGVGIFGSPAAAAPQAQAAPSPAAPAPNSRSAQPAPASAQAAPSAVSQSAAKASPQAPVDVAAVMDKLATQSKEKLDWRRSIVDLMKLLDLDSSLSARKELAKELHFSGDTNDSASMNIWLHKQVMVKLAENGGKVPDDLKS